MIRNSVVTAAILTALGVSTVRADIPPPPGNKQVTFGVRVENVERFPEYVLLVFPWGLSDGAPIRSIGEVQENTVLSFGRRVGGVPTFYAMRRADFDAWRTGNPRASLYPSEEQIAAMNTLFASDRVVNCNVTISPVHVVPDSGPDEVVHVFRAEEISAAACRITPRRIYQPRTRSGRSSRGGSAGCSARR